jgi:DNA-binding transcriptional LysR family regulator
MATKLDSDSQIGRRIKLRDLHLFFTVVQHGSMAKAASQLGISQPSISEVIADLEHTLGARLFDRRPRGVEPTMYGQALLSRTRAVFDELRQGIKDIEFLADPTSGEVRIGCSVAASVTFLSPIIRGFSEAYPGVALRVEDVPASGWEQGLIERKHDLLLQWCVPPLSSDRPEGEVKVESLFDDNLVAVAGLQSPWARRRKIDLAELVDERWIVGPPGTANYAGIAESFRTRGLAMPKVVLETLSLPLRTYFLASGPFIATMPLSLASQSPVKILPVELPIRPWQFALFTLKDRTVSAVVDRFIEHVRELTRPMRGKKRGASARK